LTKKKLIKRLEKMERIVFGDVYGTEKYIESLIAKEVPKEKQINEEPK
jgi:hypothetical protein